MLNRKFLVCNPIIQTEDYDKVVYLFTEILENGSCRNWFKGVDSHGASHESTDLHKVVDFLTLSPEQQAELVELERSEEDRLIVTTPYVPQPEPFKWTDPAIMELPEVEFDDLYGLPQLVKK